MGLFKAIGGVFLGCWLNAIFLELLVRVPGGTVFQLSCFSLLMRWIRLYSALGGEFVQLDCHCHSPEANTADIALVALLDPACGNLVTFSQFVLISIIGFIFTSKFGTRKRVIPIKGYIAVVCMFFSTNLLNNIAFNFNISMPLHMIFRSSSLITNMIMGIIILKKRYGFSKYLSVALITIGVIMCTLESSQEFVGEKSDDLNKAYSGLFWWCLGILILIASLLISALLGIYQEVLFQKYGKVPFEALFYTHLIPIPFFFLMFSDIKTHFNIALNSELIDVPLLTWKFPVLLVYLAGNISTQYLCISSVYRLSAETTSFTLNLVITLRKFVSLLFSIVYFQNNFTLIHWLGTIMVFIGTAIFTELPQKLISIDAKKKKA